MSPPQETAFSIMVAGVLFLSLEDEGSLFPGFLGRPLFLRE